MANESRNVIVGAGRLWTATQGTATPVYTADASAEADFEGDADWTQLGFTQEGVEVSYQPDYGEVEVDQLKDAAVLFNQGLTVMMNTNLAEATLENLLVAWGFPDESLSSGTFSIGVPEEEPVERALAVIGRAPKTVAGKKQERIYHARRVVSMEGSNHSLRRTEATIFPVSFRLLPDPTAAGSEYGTITDRLTESAL